MLSVVNLQSRCILQNGTYGYAASRLAFLPLPFQKYPLKLWFVFAYLKNYYMRTPLGAFVILAIMLLIDWYVYQAIKTVSGSSSSKTRQWVFYIYWGISLLAISFHLILNFADPLLFGKHIRSHIFATIIGIYLSKLLVVFFLAVDDLVRLFKLIGRQFGTTSLPADAAATGDKMNRNIFLNWLGVATGTTLFGTLMYGYTNKYKYQVKRQQLSFNNLPKGFKGLKIVQISDIHSGSLTNTEAVMKGINLIMAEKPDLILFTGDLVNNIASEMHGLIHVFSLLKAPMGVYSVLGNHDYGDYYRWPQRNLTKEQNFEDLKNTHATMGWKLLLNEHVALERNGDKIALLGIENWGAKARFIKYGKMADTYRGTENYPFKILMSHDPSHWEAEVIKQYTDIDLTLSGHTHGMQFGVDVPGMKWSPVKYIYNQWSGLYQHQQQKLYVNTGFGFIGYPGRVGFLPEITVLELV
jgi:uncharacterized protein